MQFSSLSIHPDLLKSIQQLGFEQPTPIQADAIPAGLAGRDVLACAQTGSGKTAAFVLPILQQLMAKPRGKTRALVLAPTRELAQQVADHLRALAANTRITSAAVYGGVGMQPQEQAFRQGVDVIVATPGRLLDHLQYSYARLDTVDILVLDEADRMLDMGFLPDIKRILGHVKNRKQTLFFSATMPPPIVQLTRELLRDPARINIERQAAPASGIDQAVYPVAQELKTSLLLELLSSGTLARVLVFTRTKHRANRLADFLEKRGVSSARIHGNRSQNQRTLALEGFKRGKHKVLVATDIAARGIDVESLEHVVNFDVPMVPEDYIHRVGRTGRADETGEAFTFVSPEEESDLRAIERAIGRKLPRRLVEGFDYTARTKEKFEIPIGERIAQIRARKADERARSRAKSTGGRGGSVPAGRRQSFATVSSLPARPAATPTNGGQAATPGPRMVPVASAGPAPGTGWNTRRPARKRRWG
jgi:ATP-dependent RNA helicase RhlE